MSEKHLFDFNTAVHPHPDKVINPETGRTLLIDAIWSGDKGLIAELLAAGADPDKADKDGKSPLHHAADLRQADTIGLLLQKGAQVNPRDKHLATPLFFALDNSLPLELIDYLLKAGMNANIPDDQSRLPLHYAAQYSGKDLIERLMQATENADYQDNAGNTPLHLACQTESEEAVNGLEAVQTLLAGGAAVSSINNKGNTPLHDATANADNNDIAPYFLATEAAQLVNTPNLEGQTPLHLAILADKGPLVRQMLELGANANAVDNDGNTPMHLAINTQSKKLMIMLIEHGADVSKSVQDSASPLLVCALSAQNTPAIRLLLQYDADPDAPGRDTASPLLLAAAYHNAEAIALLLKAGAAPDYTNKGGMAALHIACMNSTEDSIAALLSGGANPNIQDPAKRTPLHMVANSPQNIKLSQMLLDNGADPLIKDITGRSACDLAYNAGNKPIMDMFAKKLAEKGLTYTPPPPRPNPSTSWNIC